MVLLEVNEKSEPRWRKAKGLYKPKAVCRSKQLTISVTTNCTIITRDLNTVTYKTQILHGLCNQETIVCLPFVDFIKINRRIPDTSELKNDDQFIFN